MNSTSTQTEDLRDLYRERILDHARSPRHFGKLPNVTHMADGINPLCRGNLKMYIQIDTAGRIAAIDKMVRPATSAEDMVTKLAEIKVAMR